ncbi:MAG: hypothetical protein JNN01_01670 [Opitutaceae bacterium]|nr:hypothetical protein [Opitutaceae bacterium]
MPTPTSFSLPLHQAVVFGYATLVAASTPAQSVALGDRGGAQGLSIRGVSVGGIKRAGFIGPPIQARNTTRNTDNVPIEQLEVTDRPHSILSGSAGGGGDIHSVSKRAHGGQQTGTVLNARYFAQPRMILWTNSVSF